MNLSKLINVGLFGVASFFGVESSFASPVQIEYTGTISHNYIMNGDCLCAESALDWELGSAISAFSTLNFNLSYDSNMSSIGIHPHGSPNGSDLYKGAALSVSLGGFKWNILNTLISIQDNLCCGSGDQFNVSFEAPDNTGLEFSFNNEIYYLLEARATLVDSSGKTLGSSGLLTEQSQIDGFWLNNTNPAFRPMFEVVFAKDLSANSHPNGYWPNGDVLYISGYIDNAKLTSAQVTEPAGLILLLVGSAGFLARRFWHK